MAASMAYFVFGLALTSMCINIVKVSEPPRRGGTGAPRHQSMGCAPGPGGRASISVGTPTTCGELNGTDRYFTAK